MMPAGAAVVALIANLAHPLGARASLTFSLALPSAMDATCSTTCIV